MARFEKGQSGNPKGKPKGSKNRTSDDIRKALLKLLDDSLEQLKKDLKGMESKDRARLLVNLAKHCTAPATNPERLTEDQLLQIIQYLKENEKEEA